MIAKVRRLELMARAVSARVRLRPPGGLHETKISLKEYSLIKGGVMFRRDRMDAKLSEHFRLDSRDMTAIQARLPA
jgi:hypothetical protein